MIWAVVRAFQTAETTDPMEWEQEWPGFSNSLAYVQYVTFLWTKANAVQKDRAVCRLLCIYGSLRTAWPLHFRSIESLLRTVVPHLLERGAQSGDLRPWLEACLILLKTCLSDLSLEEQQMYSGFCLQNSVEESEWLEEINSTVTSLMLELDKRKRIADLLRRQDVLAILYTYYHTLRYVGIRRAVHNRDLLGRLEDYRCTLDQIAVSTTCPPVLLTDETGSHVLCEDFFRLAERLLAPARDSETQALRELRRAVIATAGNEVGRFFEALLNSGQLPESVVNLIRQHRAYVLGGLQRHGADLRAA